MAGLSAASLLQREGFEVTVVEARDRVGGRTLTVRNDRAKYVDLGGAYVGPGQRRVQRMCKQFGLDLYKVNTDGKKVIELYNWRAVYEGVDPPIYNPLVAMDINDLLRRINNMAEQVPVDAPWSMAQAREWDAMTVREYLDRTCWFELSKRACAVMLRSLFCCETHEVSLLSFVWYVRCGENVQRMISIEDGAQERKIVGGSMTLCENLARDVNVLFNKSVTKITQSPDTNRVSVTTSDGDVITSDYVICSVPLALLNRIVFEPTLDAIKSQLSQHAPMGSIIKTVTFYRSAFWGERGLTGEMGTDSGMVAYCIDDTKPDGSEPAIMGFILADEARRASALSQDERKRRVTEQYARVFGIDDFRYPVHYEEYNWMQDPYAGGCYTSNYGPGVMTSFAQVLRQKHGRVHFAGTETATAWAGTRSQAVDCTVLSYLLR